MDVPNIGALINERGHDEAVRLLRANGLDNVADAAGAMAEPEAAEWEQEPLLSAMLRCHKHITTDMGLNSPWLKNP